MTIEEVLASTPAWQQVIDRHLFTLAIAVALLVVYLSVRRREGGAAPLPPREIRRLVTLIGLAALAFVAMWMIGLAMATNPKVLAIDQAVAAWARAHVGTDLLVLLSWISEAGSTLWLTLVTFAMGFWQWRRGRGVIGLGAMLASGANGLAIRGLKAEFERIRPEHLHAGPLEPGFSYPSGHAAGSMLVYGLLAWLVTREWAPRRRLPAFCAALAMAILIATTRVLLQVHYLSDVVGGMLLGSGVLLITVVWIRSRERLAAGSVVGVERPGA